MSFLTKYLLPHQRHLTIAIRALSPAVVTVPSSLSALTPPNTRSLSSYKPQNPKIKITLEQLRMAARGSGRRAPICHEEHQKVMNALEAAKFENALIYKYVMEYDKCREQYEANKKFRRRSTLAELNKYVVRRRK